MAHGPTAAIVAARAALGARLREVRVEAGMTGVDLAARTGWSASKISRIEHARQVPTARDVEQAVQARLDRQRVMYAGDHRFVVVLEDAALYARIGAADMMVAQLNRLIAVAALPRVSLGIIPRGVDRTMWASPGFWIYDDERVLVETPTAQLTITQPREVAVYARTFAELSAMAVVGSEARRLITDAIAAFGG